MVTAYRRMITAGLAAIALMLGGLLVVPAAHAAGTVTGVVKSKLAGGATAPYADASIAAAKLQDDGYSYGTETWTNSAANGSFTLSGLEDGDYRLRIIPQNFGQPGDLGYEYYDNKWSPYGITHAEVRGGTVTLNEIVLEQPGWVTGTVKDTAGNPIPGATIGVQDSPDSGGYGFEIEPDGTFDTRDGEYTKNLIPGTYTVEASVSGAGAEDRSFRSQTKTVAVSANAASTPQDFVLEERKKAVFTVTDSTGAPMKWARVDMRIQREPGDPFESPQYGPITTDGEGKFDVDDDAHAYKLRFFPEDDYAGTNQPEWWNGDTGAYTYDQATAITFPTAAPYKRNFNVQLATPAITPGAVSIDGDVTHVVEDPHGDYTVNAVRLGQTITANPGTWAPSDVTLSYQWHKNGQPIAGATEPELTITQAIATDMWVLRLHVTGSKAGAQSVEAESEYINDPVLAGDEPVTFTRPTITGTAQVGKPLTAVPGAWGPSGVTLSYQWLADGAVINGATGSTFTPADAQRGKAISVRATGSLAGYTSVSRTSTATAKVTAAEIGVGTPTITGTPTAGNTLTAVPGTWTPSGVAFAYQWLADDTALQGATSSTLALTNAHAGKRITVRVTGTREGSTPKSEISAATEVVQGTLSPAVPTVNGTPQVGVELTATPGTWGPNGVTLAYQWLAGGQEIDGATGASFTPGVEQQGAAISVRVTGSLTHYVTASRTSAATAPVAAADLVAGTPTITGSAVSGGTLTAQPGTWAPSDITFTYQWLANGTAISGATAKTLRLSNAHAGKRISVRVTGTSGGSALEATSKVTAVVTGVLKGATPKITGKTKVGKKLTAKPGAWSPAPVSLKYQWLRNGKVIKGATKATYKLSKADAGKRIQVRVTGKKTSYKTLVKTSAKSKKIKR